MVIWGSLAAYASRPRFDVVIVGAGGRLARPRHGRAGLRTACSQKLFRPRSKQCGQGGIAARSSTWPDKWQGTCTTRSRVGLARRNDAMEYIVREAPAPSTSSRTTRALADRARQDYSALRRKMNELGGPGQRTCAVADRTGHDILTDVGQSRRHNADSYRVFCIDC